MLKSVPIVSAIQAFVIILYCVNGVPGSSLLIESTYSMIIISKELGKRCVFYCN